MVEGPDVRWDGISHQTILEWVSHGPAAALTSRMEQRLKSTAQALADASDVVNTAIQNAGGDWQGGAADRAMAAMRALRSFDEGMHFTSNVGGIRAFGQSDSSGFVRANVPPAVNVGPPPNPTGLPVDVILATEDYDRKQAAAKQAELRAREVMQQYTTATVERAAVLTPLTPPPRVVLDTSDTSTKRPAPHGPQPPGTHKQDASAPPDGHFPPSDSGGGPSPSEHQTPVHNSVSPRPQSTSAEETHAQSLPASAQQPATPVPAPERSSAPPPPPSAANPTGGPSAQPGGDSPWPLDGQGERAGQPGVGRRPVGPTPAETPRERLAPTGRGVLGAAGGPTPVGIGGCGAGQRGEDRERQAKYALPSDEHFADQDDRLPDPYRDGWHVAPAVIGDEHRDREQP